VVESSTLDIRTPSEVARYEQAMALMSAAADPVRWTVLHHLADHGTTCVCKLQERVPVAANLLSYHLKVLREAGLFTTARRGRWVDYTLADDASARLRAALPVPGVDPSA
jgi:ArsR family transcriptional regulator